MVMMGMIMMIDDALFFFARSEFQLNFGTLFFGTIFGIRHWFPSLVSVASFRHWIPSVTGFWLCVSTRLKTYTYCTFRQVAAAHITYDIKYVSMLHLHVSISVTCIPHVSQRLLAQRLHAAGVIQ